MPGGTDQLLFMMKMKTTWNLLSCICKDTYWGDVVFTTCRNITRKDFCL